jgi:hypothetical protein
MAGQGVSASKLNPSEKRAMESNPAVVLGSVMYEVNGRFQVGGETVFFGPVAVGGTGSSAMLTGIVLPTYRGTVPEMISAVHLEAYYTTPILSVFLANGASRGKRSAEVIGGAAAAGAGAGTGTQYMSNAEPVTIPSEARIEFTLRTPVTLTP